jgi:hypothetical protein
MKEREKVPRMVVWGSVVVFVLAALPAFSAREMEDLNLTERIVLTLANSMSREYQYEPDDVSRLMKRADFYIDEERGSEGQGKGLFSYSFRTRVGDFSGSGYFRIASPALYRKPKTEEGWSFLGEDSETKASVWSREVERSRAEKYNEVEASLKRGNLVLTVSLRRPPEESASEGREAVLRRFGMLVENARRYGILCRVVIEMVSGEEGRELADGCLLNVPGRESDETRMSFRIYTVDHKGDRLANIDRYVITLGGFLGKFARIEGAAFNRQKNQYEVTGRPEVAVRLVFPAVKDREFAQAMRQDAKMRSGFGIVVDVDVTFKASPRPPV